MSLSLSLNLVYLSMYLQQIAALLHLSFPEDQALRHDSNERANR